MSTKFGNYRSGKFKTVGLRRFESVGERIFALSSVRARKSESVYK